MAGIDSEKAALFAKQLNIKGSLNDYALVLAQHCASKEGVFYENNPGWIATFVKGTSEVRMKDIADGKGDENLSFIFVNEGVSAEFYEHDEFKGRSFSVEGPEIVECLVGSNKGGGAFNDVVSSIRLTYQDPKYGFSESAMNPADGFLPYTRDSYGENETQFTVMHNGKRYKIQTNSYSPENHALTLFIDPTNNPGLTFWAAQTRKPKTSFYYKGYEGSMVVGEGDWVEIQYPEAQAIKGYTLHFNMMTTDGRFIDQSNVPPTAWVVVGSKDGKTWDVLHEANVGKSGWMKSEWSDYSDIRDGTLTQTIGSNEAYTHYRLLVTRWGDDLPDGDTSKFRRLDRWVLGSGAGSGAGSGTGNGAPAEGAEGADAGAPAAPAPPPPPAAPASTTDKLMTFLSDYKWFVLGAIVVILALIMFM